MKALKKAVYSLTCRCTITLTLLATSGSNQLRGPDMLLWWHINIALYSFFFPASVQLTPFTSFFLLISFFWGQDRFVTPPSWTKDKPQTKLVMSRFQIKRVPAIWIMGFHSQLETWKDDITVQKSMDFSLLGLYLTLASKQTKPSTPPDGFNAALPFPRIALQFKYSQTQIGCWNNAYRLLYFGMGINWVVFKKKKIAEIQEYNRSAGPYLTTGHLAAIQSYDRLPKCNLVLKLTAATMLLRSFALTIVAPAPLPPPSHPAGFLQSSSAIAHLHFEDLHTSSWGRKIDCPSLGYMAAS